MDAAGPVSMALFLWVQPMMRTGYRRALVQGEALPLPERLRPSAVRARLAELWSLELAASKTRGSAGGPSVLRVLRLLCGRDVGVAVACQTLAVLLKFSSILLLRRLVQLASAGLMEDARGQGLALAAGLAAVNAGEGVVASLATFHVQLALYRTQIGVTQAVLWKGARLHPEAQDKHRRGDLVTLALSDFNRIIEMSGVLMQGLGAPVLLAFAFALFLALLGPTTLAAVVNVTIAGLIVRRVGAMQGRSFRGKMVSQGHRLAVLNEMLQSVRFTKFYALEEHYEERLRQHRQEETRHLRLMKLAVSLNWPVASTVPITTAIVILSLHFALHGQLPTTADTFAVLGVARFLYQPFAFFGGFLGAWNMLTSASGRLQALLLQPEIQRQPVLLDPAQGEAAADEAFALKIHKESFSWSLRAGQPLALQKVSLAVPRGELWAVVGELGSGKSSILAAVLGEIPSVGTAGGAKAEIHASGGSRAYVAQEPMVMNATLRENVLFGAEPPVGEEAYGAALAAAALGPDLEMLPAGDATEIGEKGITLSGGQKARVALARAVFASRPGSLVLLDDPLSAVDAHVGAHIFEECIVGALQGCTRLLVTNQLHFLQHQAVSRVLVMEKGRITEEGTFRQLMAARGAFSRMAASVGAATGKGREAAQAKADKAGGVGRAASEKRAGGGQLVKDERKAEGSVTRVTFLYYIHKLGGYGIFAALCCGCWAFHLAEVLPDVFLVMWQDDLLGQPQGVYLLVWVIMAMAGLAATVSARVSWTFTSLRACKRVHTSLVQSVMHCPMSFFDRTPSGRIMNRLGEDMMLVDFSAPLQLEVLVIILVTVVDQLIVTMIARPLTAPFIVVFGVLFFKLREVHRRTSRETIRWWMVTKSPLFHIFEEILSGKTTIYAFGREDHFCDRFEEALEVNCRWLLSRDASGLWTEQRHCFIASLIVGTLAVQMVVAPGIDSASFGAVALVYALQLGFSLKTLSYFFVQVEGVFSSVERVMEFARELPQEPPWRQSPDEGLQVDKWPGKRCTLLFDGVCVRYLPHMPRVLDGLTVHFAAQEKVGIVGRTGCGKSTFMGALFRLFELEAGRILLGGVDIATVGLALLRRCITIVPQDPILFSGELRKNLDPLGSRSDGEIWEALRRCSLLQLVEGLDDGLGAKVSEGGSNFSLGERQVLCLARALLRDTPVLCLDEATANIDHTNDQRIQAVLQREVKNHLLLTIAHRLRTILDYDRVLVLDAGRVAQLGPPGELLEKPGPFRELAAQAGIRPQRGTLAATLSLVAAIGEAVSAVEGDKPPPPARAGGPPTTACLACSPLAALLAGQTVAR